MTSADCTTTEALLRFNQDLLDQALALVAAHDAPGAPPYARPVGAHLRHVVEHFEALLAPSQAGEVDYDRRARDAELERCTHTARRRLSGLRQALAQLHGADLQVPLRVRGQAGLAGEVHFAVDSTLGRELVFVASHAVHHYALLKTFCVQHGIATAAEFGQAPATVAHARATRPFTPAQETPCTTQPATA